MSAADPEVNTWLIKRNCSASPLQLAVVFGSLVAVSFVFGLGFAAFGLWMVLPFVGLELIAVAAAFLCHGWHAADFERISVATDSLSVEHVEGTRKRQWQFDPRHTHVYVESRGRRWGRRVHVFLMAPDASLELGRYLLDHRRSQLGREIMSSLMRARAGAM